jgi:hypothetical protein
MVGLPANTGAAKMKSVKTARMKNFTSAFLLQEIVIKARALRRNGEGIADSCGQSEQEDTMRLWGTTRQPHFRASEIAGEIHRNQTQKAL